MFSLGLQLHPLLLLFLQVIVLPLILAITFPFSLIILSVPSSLLLQSLSQLLLQSRHLKQSLSLKNLEFLKIQSKNAARNAISHKIIANTT